MVMSMHLVQMPIEALDIHPLPVVYWTDSTTVLKWIGSDQLCHKLFVGCRIEKIKRFSSPPQWHYCPMLENIAGYVYCGLLMSDMTKMVQWMQGPAFLPNADQLPKNRDVSNMDVDQKSFELATAHATVTIVQTCPSVSFTHPISRARSLYTISKRFAYLHQFVESQESGSELDWGSLDDHYPNHTETRSGHGSLLYGQLRPFWTRYQCALPEARTICTRHQECP